VDLALAVADGLDMSDLAQATAVLGLFSAASDELGSDTDAAILDMISGAMSRVADPRRDPEPVV